MKICFPVQKDEGQASAVYGHFGSAPVFLVLDSGSNSITAINNRDQHHAHGQCNPMKALDNQEIDAVVVGGIGAGALTKLNQMGIKVYRAQQGTVAENASLLFASTLTELTVQGCCGGHSKGGHCAH